MTTDNFDSDWLVDVRVQFEKMKRLAEGALAQAGDDQLNVALDAESNSLAVIVEAHGRQPALAVHRLPHDRRREARSEPRRRVRDRGTRRAAGA